MRRFLLFLSGLSLLAFVLPCLASAQVPSEASSTTSYYQAQVVAIPSQTTQLIPGTNTTAIYQSIRAQFLQGPLTGQVMTLQNNAASVSVGEIVYVEHEVDPSEGINTYTLSEPYRLPVLAFLLGLFLILLVAFGGKQGLRGLLSLIVSLFLIGWVLLPGILSGYSPVLVSLGTAALIIIVGSYLTHGFTKTTSAAVIGMLLSLLITGALAYGAVSWGHFSGYSSEEAGDLNFATAGSINLISLLLGGLLIGLLGVLYDAAIGQAVAVEELLGAGSLSPKEVRSRALRIGREHIGALVNTLAIAYVGASLPLLLLFSQTNTQGLLITVNQELFATELIRIIIGSIGLILAVPLTTLVALYLLSQKSPAAKAAGQE